MRGGETEMREVYVARVYLEPRRMLRLYQIDTWADLGIVPPELRELLRDVVAAAKRLEGARLVRRSAGGEPGKK